MRPVDVLRIECETTQQCYLLAEHQRELILPFVVGGVILALMFVVLRDFILPFWRDAELGDAEASTDDGG